jgi:hypothetical protein
MGHVHSSNVQFNCVKKTAQRTELKYNINSSGNIAYKIAYTVEPGYNDTG